MQKDKKIIKYIGIDWGEKRIGLAVADNEIWMAMPLAIVYSFGELVEFLAIEQPDQLVVGMPYTMAGKTGHTAEKVNEFIRMLEASTNYPVAIFDERLTSSAVDSLYDNERRPEERDAIAAMVILQNYIDQLDKGQVKIEKELPNLK
jgi:putative Holliday junction resolvase